MPSVDPSPRGEARRPPAPLLAHEASYLAASARIESLACRSMAVRGSVALPEHTPKTGASSSEGRIAGGHGGLHRALHRGAASGSRAAAAGSVGPPTISGTRCEERAWEVTIRRETSRWQAACPPPRPERHTRLRVPDSLC